MHGLGRAAAFASASFIGGAGLIYALKSVVSAAEGQQAVLALTEQAVKSAGQSYEEYAGHIESVIKAQTLASGFTDNELLKSFDTLVRKTGDVNRALVLNSLATNIARGRNISLEAATNLVIRASLGLSGALRRLGIDAPKAATGIQLLQLLSQKYAGSAAAFAKTAAGAQAIFNAEIDATEETIGTALLPTITRLLTTGSAWLSQQKNQERIQRDVNQAIKDGAQVAEALKDAFHDVQAVVGPLIRTVGGLKNAVELLLGLMAVAKVRAFATALGLIGPAAVTAGAGVATAEGEIAAAGSSAVAATTSVGLLRGALGRLGAIGAITIGIDLVLNHKAVDDWFNRNLPNFLSFSGLDAIKSVTNQFKGEPGQPILPIVTPDLTDNLATRFTPNRTSPPADLDGSTTQEKAKAGRDAATATALAKAQAEGSQSQIVAAANARLGFIRDTIAFAKKLENQRGPTKALESTLQKFYADENSTQGIIDGISEQASSDAAAADSRAAAAARAAQAKEAREAAAKQRAYEALVRTRLVNLRAEVNATKNGTAAHKAAEADLTSALLAEVRDTKLSDEKRAGYNAALVTERNREASEQQKLRDATAALARKERDAAEKAAQAARDTAAKAEQASDQNLQNAVARAQLIKNPAKELAAEKKADQAIIDAIKQRIREKHLTGLALAQAQGDLLSAEKTLQDLVKQKDKAKTAGSSFSLQDLFKEATSEFATYGSNIGAGPLSPQDARAGLAQTISAKNTVVVQNFYSDRGTGQAISDAYQVARNMK